MEPIIRNFRAFGPGQPARLISLDDNPPTCTLSYSVIEPGKTSSHHIHQWEHEVYIIEGAGTLICDGTEYPVKTGLGVGDGATNHIMAFRSLDPGSAAPKHAHPGEHLAYFIEGNCLLECDGEDHLAAEGDAVLVPPNSEHEWRSNSDSVAKWLVFNPAPR